MYSAKINSNQCSRLLEIDRKLTLNTIPRPRPEKTLPGSSQTSPKRLQDVSRTPPRRLQDASEPPTRCLKIVYESTRGFKPPPSHAKDSSKRRPTTEMRLQAASQKSPRRPGTSPRRFQIGISDEKYVMLKSSYATFFQKDTIRRSYIKEGRRH